MPGKSTEVDAAGLAATGGDGQQSIGLRGDGQQNDGQYVVVARRYRPQGFDSLVGQEHVSRALQGAIASNRIGHAYLFTGARGVGKTSTARIFAKALNCVEGPTSTPCNRCDLCVSVSTGEDVDVLEIDGASNRGIDEIRELRQNVRVRPSRSRYKIYIIDEVHMLTKEAFNALLKTLEEPPEHVKFIFCTTEAEKIPITILSRCQRFDFAGIQTDQIVRRLADICTSESANVDREALEILARRAAGSMRDSQSLLEQLLSFGHDHVTADDVHAMLGTAGGERLGSLAEQLVGRRPGAALVELDAAIDSGVDVGQLLEQLLGYFRDVMLLCVGAEKSALIYTWGAEQERVGSAARALGLETVLAILQILDQTLARLRYSTQRRTLAELALVRIAHLEELEDLAELATSLAGDGPSQSATPGRASPGASGPGARAPVPSAARATPPPPPPSPPPSRPPRAQANEPAPAAPNHPRPTDSGPVRHESEAGPDDVEAEYPSGSMTTSRASAREGAVPIRGSAAVVEHSPPGSLGERTGPPPAKTFRPEAAAVSATAVLNTASDMIAGLAAEDATSARGEMSADQLAAAWQRALSTLPHMLAQQASQAESVVPGGPGRVVVTFPQSYNLARSYCEQPAKASQLEQALAQVIGGRVNLEFRCGEARPAEVVEARAKPPGRNPLLTVSDHPFVHRACELFDAQPVRVDEPPSAGR